MKLPSSSSFAYMVGLVTILITVGCTKENSLTPSGLDENFYHNNDNPNDSIVHAMFMFYKETGVANFYSDTISIQQISKPGEVPERYRYIKASLNHIPAGFSGYTSTPLSNKHFIPGVLELIKKEVLPKLPEEHYTSCLLFLNDILNPNKFLRPEIAHGMAAVAGFNTVGIVTRNTGVMIDDEKKMYAASILAGLTVNKITESEATYLANNFFNVSREQAKSVFTTDVYAGAQFLSSVPPDPRSLALIYFPVSNAFFYESLCLPIEDSDLRSFLTMVYRYDVETFTNLYNDYPFILQKYTIIRDLLIRKGYTLPG